MMTSAKLALILPIAGLAAGWLVSECVTPRYVSTARLAVGDSLSHSVKGTAYLNELEKDVLDNALYGLIANPNLDIYGRERAQLPVADIVSVMRRDIRIEAEMSGGSYIPFRLSFTYRDPARAQATVGALIEKFSEWNRLRLTDAGSAAHRQDRPVDRLEARVAAIEKRLGVTAPLPAEPALPDFVPPDPATVKRLHDVVSFGPYRPTQDSFGLQFEVIDPPSRAVKIYPDLVQFMAIGFAAGLLSAAVVASFGRRSGNRQMMEQPV